MKRQTVRRQLPIVGMAVAASAALAGCGAGTTEAPVSDVTSAAYRSQHMTPVTDVEKER